jgi:hypothetical protein
MYHKQFCILSCALVILSCSCSSAKHIVTKYYTKNGAALDSIAASYKVLNRKKPFSLQFTNKHFNRISIDIITDSIKYVYAFDVEEPRFKDTLSKYGLNAAGITELVRGMQSVRCTWINNLSYNSGSGAEAVTFMSIRQVSTNYPFVPPKYYILIWFSRPQYFDSEGRLLTGRKLKQVRKINNDIFRRVNDKVCYTVSSSFR